MKLQHRMSELKTVLGILHGSRTFGGPIQADLRVYRALHSLKRHAEDLENLTPGKPLERV